MKKTEFLAYNTPIKADGIIAINIRDDDELVSVRRTSGDDDILIVSRKGQAVRFHESNVRAMGRDTSGVRGMNVDGPGNAVLTMDVARDDQELLVVTENGFGKRTSISEYRKTNRGAMGVGTIKLTDAKGALAGALVVREHEELVFISQSGMVQRTAVRGISRYGRLAQGVKLMNMKEDDLVSAVALVVESAAESGGASADGSLIESPDQAAGVGGGVAEGRCGHRIDRRRRRRRRGRRQRSRSRGSDRLRLAAPGARQPVAAWLSRSTSSRLAEGFELRRGDVVAGRVGAADTPHAQAEAGGVRWELDLQRDPERTDWTGYGRHVAGRRARRGRRGGRRLLPRRHARGPGAPGGRQLARAAQGDRPRCRLAPEGVRLRADAPARGRAGRDRAGARLRAWQRRAARPRAAARLLVRDGRGADAADAVDLSVWWLPRWAGSNRCTPPRPVAECCARSSPTFASISRTRERRWSVSVTVFAGPWRCSAARSGRLAPPSESKPGHPRAERRTGPTGSRLLSSGF